MKKFIKFLIVPIVVFVCGISLTACGLQFPNTLGNSNNTQEPEITTYNEDEIEIDIETDLLDEIETEQETETFIDIEDETDLSDENEIETPQEEETERNENITQNEDDIDLGIENDIENETDLPDEIEPSPPTTCQDCGKSLDKGTHNEYCEICNKCDCGVTHSTLTPDIFGELKGYEYYLDFTFEIPNEIIYDYSNETNEALFAEIVSGKKRYQDYLGWFASYPQYIFRFNQAHLILAETIIQDGKLSQADKIQYGGLLLYDNDGIMRLFASSSTGINYRIYINEDLTVRNFTIWITLNTDDFHQIDYVFTPIKDNNDKIISYYLSYAHLAVWGNEGRIYLIQVFYELEMKTLAVAYGGIHKTYFDYISYIKIVCDQQNNELFLMTESVGTWNLQQVWETYKEQCLTTPYDYEHYGRIVIVLV